MSEPQLITTGRIAVDVKQPLHRVLHILRTRDHIRPAARAGTLRLYRRTAIALVRYELNAVDARQRRKGDR